MTEKELKDELKEYLNNTSGERLQESLRNAPEVFIPRVKPKQPFQVITGETKKRS